MEEDEVTDLGKQEIRFTKSVPKEVARLYVEHGVLKFAGDMDEGAKRLFEHYLQPMCDHYIRERLKTIAGGG